MREKAKPTVQIDDDKVKVTRWDFFTRGGNRVA